MFNRKQSQDSFFPVAIGTGLVISVAFVVTVPVNKWMIGRGLGHAVVHEMHHH